MSQTSPTKLFPDLTHGDPGPVFTVLTWALPPWKNPKPTAHRPQGTDHPGGSTPALSSVVPAPAQKQACPRGETVELTRDLGTPPSPTCMPPGLFFPHNSPYRPPEVAGPWPQSVLTKVRAGTWAGPRGTER